MIFFSGQLLHNVGWSAVNLGALPLVLLTVAATVPALAQDPEARFQAGETPVEAAVK